MAWVMPFIFSELKTLCCIAQRTYLYTKRLYNHRIDAFFGKVCVAIFAWVRQLTVDIEIFSVILDLTKEAYAKNENF